MLAFASRAPQGCELLASCKHLFKPLCQLISIDQSHDTLDFTLLIASNLLQSTFTAEVNRELDAHNARPKLVSLLSAIVTTHLPADSVTTAAAASALAAIAAADRAQPPAAATTDSCCYFLTDNACDDSSSPALTSD